MKKAVHIIFLCLFFLFGLQCLASNKKNASLFAIEINKCGSSFTFKSISKQEKGATFSTLDKLNKKKRFSRSNQNALASLSKCNGLNLGFGTFPSTKIQFLENFELRKEVSDYTSNNSFCHRKLLSIFYSFQAFW